jgi:hypothetical protein
MLANCLNKSGGKNFIKNTFQQHQKKQIFNFSIINSPSVNFHNKIYTTQLFYFAQKSSNEWLSRQRNDEYVKKTKIVSKYLINLGINLVRI